MSVNQFKALVNELVKLRESKNMTQSRLAELMDSKQSVVARLEAGEGDVKVSTLVRWSAALGHDIKYQLRTRATTFGDVKGPLTGMTYPSGDLVRFDPFAPAETEHPPVTLVVGRPGAGKTHFVNLIARQLEHEGVAGVVVSRVRSDQSPSIDLSNSGSESLEGVAEDLVAGKVVRRSLGVPFQNLGKEPNFHTVVATENLENNLPALFEMLPDNSFLFLEEVKFLRPKTVAALKTLMRTARSRRIAIILTSTEPAELALWESYASRVFALNMNVVDDVTTIEALKLCELESSPKQLAEAKELWSGTPHAAIFKEIDGRTTIILLAGTTLNT